MKRVIYIAGITGSGKTTAANRLADHFGWQVVHLDDAFDLIGKQLKHRRADQLVWPAILAKFENGEQLKVEAYRKIIPDLGNVGNVIIEGFPIGFRRDREIIDEIIGEHAKTFFHLKPDFDYWSKLAIKKGYRPTLEMFDLWQSAFEAPAKYHEIKRGSMLIMPHDEYQRKGLTDLKWKQMQMPENMIGDEVLDLGCNAGWIGRYCLERGAAEVEGIDINWRYYDEAIVAGYSRVFLGDMNDQVWFENATRRIYDRVFCLAMLHYIQNKPDFIKRLALITKGGSGECVIEMPIAQGEAEAVEKYNGCDIPTMPLMMHWLNDAFSEVEVVGRSIAPDGQLSTRYIFKCRHVAKINVKGK